MQYKTNPCDVTRGDPHEYLAMYHGTDDRNAELIRRDRVLHPDDIGSIGLSSSPKGARGYAFRKARATGGIPTILKFDVRRGDLGACIGDLRSGERTPVLMNEIGGSSPHLFLLKPLGESLHIDNINIV